MNAGKRSMRVLIRVLLALAASSQAWAGGLEFPQGKATPSEDCGRCHEAIYREHVLGIGSDSRVPYALKRPDASGLIPLPARTSSTATAHASAGNHLAGVPEEKLSYCRGCHAPGNAQGGMTCAGCHLGAGGKVLGPRGVADPKAPHKVAASKAFQNSELCGQCHTSNKDKRIPGQEMLTFLEWKEDFAGAGLGSQQCQACHMPRTLRKVSEGFGGQPRPSARHLWAGSNSRQRHLDSLSLTLLQPRDGEGAVALQLSNIGAGHSAPTGASNRAVSLKASVLDQGGACLASREWLFAPNHGTRPDDRAFLDEDNARGDALAARADAQGRHEPPIRAGEDRILDWTPGLAPGAYAVKAVLTYSEDRYEPGHEREGGREIGSARLHFVVK